MTFLVYTQATYRLALAAPKDLLFLTHWRAENEHQQRVPPLPILRLFYHSGSHLSSIPEYQRIEQPH
jgi:hypothetical protein